jgi:hypothetical protein
MKLTALALLTTVTLSIRYGDRQLLVPLVR